MGPPTNVRRRELPLFEPRDQMASSEGACGWPRTFDRRDELRLCEQAVSARQPGGNRSRNIPQDEVRSYKMRRLCRCAAAF